MKDTVMIFICVPAALTFSSPVRFDCALVSSAEVKFDNFPPVVTADDYRVRLSGNLGCDTV